MNKNNLSDEIDVEVKKRLSNKIEELESEIRDEVTNEFNKKNGNSVKSLKKKSDLVKKEKKSSEEFFERFNFNIRFQHIVLFVSTIILIVSGIPLKFPKNSVSQFVIGVFGGPHGARSVHHLFALGLIFVGIFHLFYTMWTRSGRKDFFELLPSLQDVFDVTNQIKYFLGIRKEKVKYGRFSYIEKFDYWAVYWGLIMMIGTGAIMWLFQGKFEPGFFGEINLPFGPIMITNYVHAIAREMHSDEALLATLVIIGWHFYNVHFNPHKFPGSTVWYDGKISKEDIIEEHYLEYEKIMKEKEEVNNEVNKSEEKKETSEN